MREEGGREGERRGGRGREGEGGGGKDEASPLTENERIGEDDDLQ